MSFRICLLLCFMTGPLGAKPNDSSDLITITVVDSRLPSTYRVDSPTHTLREHDTIERMAPANTTELLRSAPGVDVTQSGGNGGLTYVSMRGGDPNFTMFLLDGIKLNDPTNSRGGGTDLYMIPWAIVDSVDILSGPAAAVKGSDSLSGIVSIRTRKTDTTTVLGDLSQHGGGAAALSTGGDILHEVHAGLTVGHDDKDSNVENDTLRQGYIQGYVTAFPGEHVALDLLLLHVDGEASSFPEDSGGDRLAVIRAPETRDYQRTVFGLTGEWDLAEVVQVHFSGSWSQLEEATDNPGIAAGVMPAVPGLTGSRDYQQHDGQLYLHAEPLSDLMVTVGGGYNREHGASSDTIDFDEFEVPASFDLKRSIWDVFFETGYRVTPRLTLQAGVRRDMPDGFDDETTLRLSAAYTIAEQGLNWSATYAEGFKLPSMFALGHSLVGNPLLQPEFSESFELGVSKYWPAQRFELDLSLFTIEYRDLIDFDPLLFTNVNRGLVDSDGVEVRADWRPGQNVSVNAHVTYNDTDVVASDTVLRRRPAWKGGIAVQWAPAARWSWVASAAYTGTFFDSSVATGMIEMPSYWRLDSTVRWQYSESFAATFSVKNLLDDDYEESVGFSNGGVTALLGFSLAL